MTSPKYVDAAYRRIDEAEPLLFQYDELVECGTADLAERALSDPYDFAPVAAVQQILPLLRRQARNTWAGRRSCEAAIGTLFRPEFNALDMVVGASQSATRRLVNSDTKSVPPPVAYAVSSLAARGQSTTHEISALLRAGMVNGARGRWRTLHEVLVVSSVLRVGNRFTADRYNNHRWIRMAMDLERTRSPWPESIPAPSDMSRKLVRRYGKTYAGPYGWASVISKRQLGVEWPRWHHLERLADLSDQEHRVASAHHSVHADALGALRLIDAAGFIHAGAQLDGISQQALQTITTLQSTTSVLLEIWERYDTGGNVAASRRLLNEVCFQAAVVVRDRIDEEAALLRTPQPHS